MAGWPSEVKSQAWIFKGPPGFSRPSGHINRQTQLAAGAGSQEGTGRAATTAIGLGYGPGLPPEDDPVPSRGPLAYFHFNGAAHGWLFAIAIQLRNGLFDIAI